MKWLEQVFKSKGLNVETQPHLTEPGANWEWSKKTRVREKIINVDLLTKTTSTDR